METHKNRKLPFYCIGCLSRFSNKRQQRIHGNECRRPLYDELVARGVASAQQNVPKTDAPASSQSDVNQSANQQQNVQQQQQRPVEQQQQMQNVNLPAKFFLLNN